MAQKNKAQVSFFIPNFSITHFYILLNTVCNFFQVSVSILKLQTLQIFSKSLIGFQKIIY